MNITIIGRKCNPREDFRSRVEKRLQKVEKLFGEDALAKVTATVEKNYQSVEVTVNKGGMLFRAEERAENINDALDECVESLIRQIRKNKTRVEKKLRATAFEDFIASDIEEETEFDLIREKSVALKPQSVEEAILQMNLLGHKFYMFLNADTDLINVVYVRNDSGYGLIVPDYDA
ncbi:MAG: ribosome-associated translation inhibitor RaiA [Ruminococcaceae bacterium]|nr:ribosome-associated translation inhibitor RaiA [Oscillospiraceae bacterium]